MLSQNSEETPTKKMKVDHSTKWRLWITDNYEYCADAITVKKSLLAHGLSQQLDPDTMPVTSNTLSRVINQVWGGKVRLTKRTFDSAKPRQVVYKNLQRRTTAKQDKHEISELQSLKQLSLQNRWALVEESLKHIILVYITRFEIDQRRVVHEISFLAEEPNDEIVIRIKSGGFKVRLDVGFPLKVSGSLTEKAEALMRFVESSHICIGAPPEFDQSNLFTNRLEIKELSKNPSVDGVRIFSKNCCMISSCMICDTCCNIKKVVKRKRKRLEIKEKDGTSKHVKKNHRYMSKEDIIALYQEERKRRLKAEKEKSMYERERDECESEEDERETDEESKSEPEENQSETEDDNENGIEDNKSETEEDESEIMEENNQHETLEKDENGTEQMGLKWKITGSDGLLKIVKL